MSKLLVALMMLAPVSLSLRDAQTVPSQLRLATRADPMAFSMMLAHASVPAGVELRATDATPRSKPDLSFKPEPRMSLSDLVDAFNAGRADYRAAAIEGVLVIRPAAAKASYLDQPSGVGKLEVTGVLNAVRKVFAGLEPSLATGGVLGSYIGVNSDQRGDDVALVLDGTGRTVLDVLNQIAKQSGKTWFVVSSPDERSPTVLKFGVMHPGGSSSIIEIAGRR